MTKEVYNNKCVLIALEQRIIGLDLKRALNTMNCNVFCYGVEVDIGEKIELHNPDLIIFNFNSYKKNIQTILFPDGKTLDHSKYNNSEILVLNRDLNIILSFSIPFNSRDIISVI
jgi:hypothetical protein